MDMRGGGWQIQASPETSSIGCFTHLPLAYIEDEGCYWSGLGPLSYPS